MTVLLTILKVIGWILLGILGLILLTVLTVLLVPIRYRADGVWKEGEGSPTTGAKGSVTR